MQVYVLKIRNLAPAERILTGPESPHSLPTLAAGEGPARGGGPGAERPAWKSAPGSGGHNKVVVRDMCLCLGF